MFVGPLIHTGHREFVGIAAVGTGSIEDRFPNIKTRLFTGSSPSRFESATNKVLVPNPRPPAAPIELLELPNVCEVKVVCPITARAA